jgi:hypothetical protein
MGGRARAIAEHGFQLIVGSRKHSDVIASLKKVVEKHGAVFLNTLMR